MTQTQFRFWISAPVLAHRQHSLLMLRKLVRATCLRRTKVNPRLALELRLPVKSERVERVELGEGEAEMYAFFKRRFYLLATATATATADDVGGGRHQAAAAVSGGGGSKAVVAKRTSRKKKKNMSGKPRRKSAGNIILLLSVLRRICDHGEALLPRAALEVWRNRDAGILSWDMLEKAAGAGRNCDICGEGVGNGEDGEKREVDVTVVEFPCGKHVACETCATPTTDDALLTCPKCPATKDDSSVSITPCVVDSAYSPSSKVSALLRNILATLNGTNLASGDVVPVKRFVSLFSLGLVCIRR